MLYLRDLADFSHMMLINNIHPVISSSMLEFLLPFMDFAFNNIEKASLHQYEVENCNKIVSVFVEK